MGAMILVMDWKASPPAIELVATSLAAISLGGSVYFAASHLPTIGAGLVDAAVAGIGAALLAGGFLAWIDRPAMKPMAFAPGDASVAEDLIVLEERVEPGVLLLDDPLPAANERVVRLFANAPAQGDAEVAQAGPGEMIARIEAFLGQDRPERGVAPRPAPESVADDASAALHAALADIRRSLGRG